MAKYVLLALTNAVAGAEVEFNEWYNEVHLPDLMKVEGFVAAQRFEYRDSNHGPHSDYRYLAVYEIEAESHEAAKAALASARSGPNGIQTADTLAGDRRSWYFEALTDRVTRNAYTLP